MAAAGYSRPIRLRNSGAVRQVLAGNLRRLLSDFERERRRWSGASKARRMQWRHRLTEGVPRLHRPR
jgi:hypothetical protein